MWRPVWTDSNTCWLWSDFHCTLWIIIYRLWSESAIKHRISTIINMPLRCSVCICLPVTWGLHRHCPVSWLQLWTAPGELLTTPLSLQLQRKQPFGFEAWSPYQPGKQSEQQRPVTAALHWHWPPTYRTETHEEAQNGYLELLTFD